MNDLSPVSPTGVGRRAPRALPAAALIAAGALAAGALAASAGSTALSRHRAPAGGARAAAFDAAGARAAGGPAPAPPAPAFQPQPAPVSAAPPLVYSPAWPASHPPANLAVRARAAILVDLDSRRVLWQRDDTLERAPASLAKMMTVMVALDHARGSRMVAVPRAAAAFDPADDTLMGLDPGQRWTVRELLYGIFLASGNDAAETLARTIVPRPLFISDMNEKARWLGLRETTFVNPTGLDAPGNVSSAYDLAVIAGWLVEHYPDVAAIAAQPRVWLYADSGHPEVDLVNLNKLVTWPYPGATGLKTGFTDAAGGCVAATAARGGRHLLAVVLGSPVMFTDAATLFDYGFAQVRG